VELLAANNPAGIIAAMDKGDIQAGMLAPPATVEATKAGFPKLVALLDEMIPLPLGSIVTTRKFADEHPEAVYAFLEAESEGVRDFFNNEGATVNAIAKYTKSDQATARQAYDTYKPALDAVGLVTVDGFKTVQQFGKNLKARQVDATSAYDNTFMQKLVASGFIKSLNMQTS
jgi:ABC-type nitrate/sulfonate/bicarbonate transport system substrate-binding protein